MTLLTPYPDWNVPRLDLTIARNVQRVELAQIPLESIIQFKGFHPASRYRCKITDIEGERMIKIWLNLTSQCVIGPIRNIVAEDMINRRVELAVMEVDKNYVMPYFKYPSGNEKNETVLDYSQARTEPYTSILLQEPEYHPETMELVK